MDTLNTLPEQGTNQHFEVVNELGQCYVNMGDYDRAKECFEKAATIDTDSAEPYLGLGVVAIQQQNLTDAEISFKVAKRLNNRCAKAYCGLGMVYQQQQRFSDAFDNYLFSLEIDTDNMTALLGLFQASCKMGSFDKVIDYLKLYLKMHPNDSSVMFTLGSLYFKQRNLLSARQMLFAVLSLEPSNTDAANLLEEVEYEIKNKGLLLSLIHI